MVQGDGGLAMETRIREYKIYVLRAPWPPLPPHITQIMNLIFRFYVGSLLSELCSCRYCTYIVSVYLHFSRYMQRSGCHHPQWDIETHKNIYIGGGRHIESLVHNPRPWPLLFATNDISVSRLKSYQKYKSAIWKSAEQSFYKDSSDKHAQTIEKLF